MGIVENLDVYLADFGVPVSFTGAPAGTVGILDVHDTHVLMHDGHYQLTGRALGVKLKTAGVASLLHIDDSVTVNSVAYKVTDILAHPPDGVFTIVVLRNPT